MFSPYTQSNRHIYYILWFVHTHTLYLIHISLYGWDSTHTSTAYQQKGIYPTHTHECYEYITYTYMIWRLQSWSTEWHTVHTLYCHISHTIHWHGVVHTYIGSYIWVYMELFLHIYYMQWNDIYTHYIVRYRTTWPFNCMYTHDMSTYIISDIQEYMESYTQYAHTHIVHVHTHIVYI